MVFDPALNPTLSFELSRAKRLNIPHDLAPVQQAYTRALTTAATDTIALVKSSLAAFNKEKVRTMEVGSFVYTHKGMLTIVPG